MDARRVALVTLVALGAVSVAGSVTASLAGVHAHGVGGLIWELGATLPLLGISTFAWLRRPDHPTTQRMAVLASLFALGSAFAPPNQLTPAGVTIPSDVVTLGREQLWVAYVGSQLLSLGIMVVAAWLLGLYPSGQIQTKTERRLLRPLWATLLLPLLVFVGRPELLPPSSVDEPAVEPNPFFVEGLDVLGTVGEGLLRTAEGVLPLIGIGLLVARYRRSPTDVRQRIKWLLVPLLVAVVAVVVDGLGLADSLESVIDEDPSGVLVVPVLPALGLALWLGLRQERTVTIDLVLRRSLVYGLLWLLIVGTYVGIATGLGIAASERFPVVVAILLTIGLTLAFQPARRWLEELADRWVFGARLGRYEAMTRLGQLLEEAFDLDELVPHLARTVRMTLGVTWARVEVDGGPGLGPGPSVVDGDPDTTEPALTVPVELAGDRLGEFSCGPKIRGTLGESDRVVLEDLARQAALAIRNVRLAAQLADRVEELRDRSDELAESRRRLVRAQEAERRRIERDLHDGIQQDLVALIGEVGRARSRLDASASASAALLGGLQAELSRVLSELRELAHGIHPQLLTDRGLLRAVEVRARRSPTPVDVRVADELRTARFPVEIEGAAYFTVCEALANVLKHSAATRAEVLLDHRDDRLVVDVIDDGIGIADTDGLVEGHGLGNLAERLRALDGTLRIDVQPGGGTRLRAEIPTSRVPEPSRA